MVRLSKILALFLLGSLFFVGCSTTRPPAPYAYKNYTYDAEQRPSQQPLGKAYIDLPCSAPEVGYDVAFTLDSVSWQPEPDASRKEAALHDVAQVYVKRSKTLPRIGGAALGLLIGLAAFAPDGRYVEGVGSGVFGAIFGNIFASDRQVMYRYRPSDGWRCPSDADLQP